MSSIAARMWAAVTAAVALAGGFGPPQPRLHDALDSYDRGQHAAAIASIDADPLTVRSFLDDANRWLDAAPAGQQPRRRLVAAAFALDAVWSRTRNEDNAFSADGDWRFGLHQPERVLLSSFTAQLPLVVWACDLVSSLDRGHPAERWWWLASVGMLGDARAWDALVGGSRIVTRPPLDAPMSRVVTEGHLVHARERFPGEPRWQLAEVVGRARRKLGPANVLLDGLGLRRADVLRDERHDRSEAMAGARREFEKLARGEPPVAGEAELHAGYVELLARRWRDASKRFERARPLLDEPFLLAVLDYFSGWAHERRGEPDQALAAYRRAHAVAPDVRNLSTLLATQLFLTNEPAEAYAILDAGLTAKPAPFDLRTMFERGDARLVPEYIGRMREALR